MTEEAAACWYFLIGAVAPYNFSDDALNSAQIIFEINHYYYSICVHSKLNVPGRMKSLLPNFKRCAVQRVTVLESEVGRRE